MEDFVIVTNIVSISAPPQRIFIDNYPMTVPGQTLRYYGVVVAKGPDAPKRGAPGYKETDMPLVHEMRAMILDDPEMTPMAAASRFVDRADGGGDSLVKARRLRERYREEFGD